MKNAKNPDGTYSQEALELGHWLFSGECDFVRGVPTLADLVDFEYPEIAFAGRSNVGKSSLINALTQRHGLARISNTPGRTQQLNFFNLRNQLYLVDMPGYGYAEAPKPLVAQWREMINQYLKGRPTLHRVYLLVDSRHEPKAVDLEMMDMLDKAAVSYQVVLTKADKIGPRILVERLKLFSALLMKHPAAHPEVLATSSEKGHGIAELRAEIAQFIS